MWLGTRDGLACFDGVRFKTLGLESGLSSVDISCLCEDKQGRLWIGTDGAGLCVMQDGHIDLISDPEHLSGSDSINCLQEDSLGQMWIGTRGGLLICRDGKSVEVPTFPNLLRSPIHDLLRSRDGKSMWIASVGDGLMVETGGQLERCPGPPDHEKLVGRSLYEDRQGRFWISIGNGAVLCRETNEWQVYNESNGLPFAYISCFAEDSAGTMWAGSLDEGLYRFDNGHFSSLRRADHLSADDIRSLYPDTDGNLWVGTRTGGLNRLSKRNVLVVAGAQGLTNDFARSVAQTSDGKLWVGTVGGSLYSGDVSEMRQFRPAPFGEQIYYYAEVGPVLATDDGSVWWGGNGSLLQWHNNQLEGCFTNESWLKNVFVIALQNDWKGGFWLGTTGGKLVHWQGGHFTEFPGRVTHGSVTCLAVQPDGSLWVGTSDSGVKRVNEGNPNIFAITNGLASISVRALHLDPDQTLWIGTEGGGLSCWRNGKTTTFTPEQGLLPRTVSQIVEDDHGFLWLGCDSGIYKVARKNLIDCSDGALPFFHARQFSLNDGLPADECSGGFCPAGLKTKSGLICFSTVHGLVFLNQDNEGAEKPPPKAVLEELLVNGRTQVSTNFTVAGRFGKTRKQLIIPPGPRDLELHYTALEFSAPEKIFFRYRLEGLDDAWTEALGRRTVYYPHLPSGEFTFHVQACNAAGVWSDDDAVLAVSAQPYYWETAWFRFMVFSALFIMLAGLLLWVLRARYASRLLRLQTLNAIERERLRISKDMHDHVGGVLTQVSQLSDLGLNEAGNKDLVKNRLERIGSQARVAVQALDEIVWATNPKNDTLVSFAEYVSRFSDEFFEYTEIRCWQEVPDVFPAVPLRADVRHNVFLAVREAFNNALKHSHGTEVWLRIKLQEQRVTLEVEDNGRGFNIAKSEGLGNGLENMRARLAEDGGEAHLESEPGKGTRVVLTFPLNSIL